MYESVTPNDNNNSKSQPPKFSYSNNSNNISNSNNTSLQNDITDNVTQLYENKQDAELLNAIKRHKKKEDEYNEETVRHQTSHQQDDTCKDFADKYTITAKLTTSGVDQNKISELVKVLESASFDDSIDLTPDMNKVIHDYKKADLYSDTAINLAMYNGTEGVSEYEAKANQAYKEAWISVKHM